MKKILSVLSAFILMISVVGCAQNESTGADKKFIKAVEKGLDARWDYLESNDYLNSDEREGLEKAIQKELEKVQEFKDAEFDNPELGKLANDYIASVEGQKEALKYYSDPIKYSEKWDDAFDKRCEYISTLVDKFGVKVDEEGYKEIKDNAQIVKEENAMNKKLDEEMKKINFELVSNEYGWKTYEATVQNNTGVDIQDFYLDIALKDADGVVAGKTQAYLDGVWKAGDKAKLTFETDVKFEKMEWEYNYFVE
ncbi:MAG: FxLYD domain-containing protein [Peptacetobacter hiranonis]|nr:FxLYD domain-containing protein [Peptacetobacter hiranonis]